MNTVIWSLHRAQAESVPDDYRGKFSIQLTTIIITEYLWFLYVSMNVKKY